MSKHAERSNRLVTWRGALSMNGNRNSHFQEDFDTRLRRARGIGGKDGEGAASVDSQTGKGMAFRIGTEIVVAVAVGGAIGFVIDTWLDTKPWFLIVFLFKPKILLCQLWPEKL